MDRLKGEFPSTDTSKYTNWRKWVKSGLSSICSLPSPSTCDWADALDSARVDVASGTDCFIPSAYLGTCTTPSFIPAATTCQLISRSNKLQHTRCPADRICQNLPSTFWSIICISSALEHPPRFLASHGTSLIDGSTWCVCSRCLDNSRRITSPLISLLGRLRRGCWISAPSSTTLRTQASSTELAKSTSMRITSTRTRKGASSPAVQE